MTHELRITIELLDSETVREPIDTETVLVGIEDAGMEGGGLGDIEAAIDELLLEHFGEAA